MDRRSTLSQANAHSQQHSAADLPPLGNTPFPRLRRRLLSTFGLWLRVCGAAVMALPMTTGSASAQTPGLVHLKKDPALNGKLMYWFVSGSNALTAPQPFPSPQPDGTTALTIPPEDIQHGGRLCVLDVDQGKVAHLTVPGLDSQILHPHRAQPGPNLLRDADFAYGPQGWVLDLKPPVKMTVQPSDQVNPPPYVPSKALRLRVEALGSQNWHAQFAQGMLDLAENKGYSVTFWAKSDRKRPLTVYASIDQPDWHNIGLNYANITLTPTWNRYAFTFQATHTIPHHGRLVFILGGALGTVDLAGVMLRSVPALTWQGTSRLEAKVMLKPGDFKYARSVQVPVTYRGQPAQGLSVILRSGDTICGQDWLQPEANGVAHFTDVPLDQKLTLTISNGKQTSPPFYRFLSGDLAASLKSIAVPDDWTGVATVAEAPRTTPAAGVIRKTVVVESASHRDMLIGLVGVLVGVACTLFWLIDTGRMNSALNRLGIRPAQKPVAAVAAAPLPSWSLPESALESPARKLLAAQSGEASGVSMDLAVVSVRDVDLETGCPRLIGATGVYAGTVFPLMEEVTTIGRAPLNDIVLADDDTTSRSHATVHKNKGQYLLIDENSANGTFINGVRAPYTRPLLLHPGDDVEIGSTLFRFEA